MLTLTDAPGRELSRALAVLSSDPDTKEVIGGQLGRTSLGILFVDLLFIPAALRGQDLGGRVADAREGACSSSSGLRFPQTRQPASSPRASISASVVLCLFVLQTPRWFSDCLLRVLSVLVSVPMKHVDPSR